MRRLNVWIHCRVSERTEMYLLKFQEKRIKDILAYGNFNIIGVSKEISAGNNSKSYALNTIKSHALRNDIDAIVVTDPTRLLISDNYYQEFKLMCNMFHVEIIDLSEIEKSILFQY